MGIVTSINQSKVMQNAAPNDLLQVLVSEIRSIDLNRSLLDSTRKRIEKKSLQKFPSQLRIFAVPDGPLGISVSSSPQDSLLGLKIIDVDEFTYFAPGDIIASVNGVLLKELSPDFAVGIFTESTSRQLTIVRDSNAFCGASSSLREKSNQDTLPAEAGQEGIHFTKTGPYHPFIKKMQWKFQTSPLF